MRVFGFTEARPRVERRRAAERQPRTHAVPTKTVNLPAEATVEDVRTVLVEAWRAGVKGITVYRYGSRPDQVLRFLADTGSSPPLLAGPEYAGGCAGRVCEF